MLRVGIVLDSYTSSAWVAKVIEDIQSSGFARLELVILHNHSEQGKSSFLRKLRERFSLFHLYERWDYQRNKADHDALAPTDVASLLNAVPLISVDFKRKEGSDNIPEDQLAKIRNFDLDVLFRFGSPVLQGGIVGVARYGLWSFHYGDSRTNHSGPPLIWELVERNPVSGSSLEIFAKSVEGRRIIYQSHSSIDQISLYCSRNPIYWKTAEFALRCLHEVQMRGMDYIQSLPACSEQETGRRRGDSAPTNLQMILFMRRYLSRWLQARLASFQSGPRTRWFIAIRRRNAVHRFDDPSEYMLMPCPRDRFYADPFLFEKDGKTFLFFEDFRFAEGRAVISYCEIGSDGSPGAPVEVLRRSFHLSYPFVFEHEGEIYMIPETRGNRRVELYRATSFPTEWTSEAVLLNDIHAVDATIQKVHGKFWMFAGVSNGKYSNSDELCLFFSDELKGPWVPHPANPVLSDVRRARPAGRLFYDEGRLIRPSQDCGKAYGYALVFSEVLTLNETEYKERQISRLEPGVVEGCVGTHTYNRTEQFEVVDRTLPAHASTMELK
jgi:hypothetical protein